MGLYTVDYTGIRPNKADNDFAKEINLDSQCTTQ